MGEADLERVFCLLVSLPSLGDLDLLAFSLSLLDFLFERLVFLGVLERDLSFEELGVIDFLLLLLGDLDRVLDRTRPV